MANVDGVEVRHDPWLGVDRYFAGGSEFPTVGEAKASLRQLLIAKSEARILSSGEFTGPAIGESRPAPLQVAETMSSSPSSRQAASAGVHTSSDIELGAPPPSHVPLFELHGSGHEEAGVPAPVRDAARRRSAVIGLREVTGQGEADGTVRAAQTLATADDTVRGGIRAARAALDKLDQCLVEARVPGVGTEKVRKHKHQRAGRSRRPLSTSLSPGNAQASQPSPAAGGEPFFGDPAPVQPATTADGIALERMRHPHGLEYSSLSNTVMAGEQALLRREAEAAALRREIAQLQKLADRAAPRVPRAGAELTQRSTSVSPAKRAAAAWGAMFGPEAGASTAPPAGTEHGVSKARHSRGARSPDEAPLWGAATGSTGGRTTTAPHRQPSSGSSGQPARSTRRSSDDPASPSIAVVRDRSRKARAGYAVTLSRGSDDDRNSAAPRWDKFFGPGETAADIRRRYDSQDQEGAAQGPKSPGVAESGRFVDSIGAAMGLDASAVSPRPGAPTRSPRASHAAAARAAARRSGERRSPLASPRSGARPGRSPLGSASRRGSSAVA